MDGTLVQEPNGLTVWEVLNERFVGTSSINRERYERFKQGLLSYPDWVALDVRGWREAGATRSRMVEAFAPLKLVEGARETVEILRSSGLRLVVISGTLDLLLDTLWPDHPFEQVFANRIDFGDDGAITGWRATPYDMQGKGEALKAVSRRTGIPLARCAFVGDSTNDVWAAREAGFTVAFNPRSEELERLAGAVIRGGDLRAILPHLLPSAAS